MNRLLRIARREYLAYVKTFGFWMSLALLPVGLSTIVVAPKVVAQSAPTPVVAIVDLTSLGLHDKIAKALAAPGEDGRPSGLVVAPPGAPFAGAADAEARLRPYLSGVTRLPGGERLDLAAVLAPAGETVAMDLWSRDVTDQHVEAVVNDAVREAVRRDGLKRHGVDDQTLAAIEANQPRLAVYSPKAAAGQVSLRDKLPRFAGFGMGLLLWMVVLTGAGMLLNSVMEEKSSRILEVLLTSASTTEIMGGKIIGVALVTATVLVFWASIAAGALLVRSPGVLGDVTAMMFSHGRWAYFALYLVGGYMMFATLYVTIGAFCETAREAQTLLGPMMIIMTVPVMFMSQSILHPDAPLLHVLTWIPLFTPFMMAARVASDPPLWEVLGTGAMMFAITGLELWVAIPAFRTGALASGRFDARVFFASVVRRATP